MLFSSSVRPAAAAAAFRQPGARALALAVLLGATLPPAPAAHAVAFTWQGSAGNGAWNNAANWVGNVAPANDGTADLFFGTSSSTGPSVQPAYSIRSLTWNAGASAYSYAGNTLTLGAGGFNQNAVNAQSFDAALTLGAAQTWTLADGTGALSFNRGVDTAGYALTVNAATTTGTTGNALTGDLTGGGSLTKTGTGLLTLSGKNSTYSGGTNVNAGTLAFGNNTSLGSGAIALAGGGELRATATATINNQVSVNAAAGIVSAAPGVNLTLSRLSLSGDLTVGTAGQTGVITIALTAGSIGSAATFTVNAGTLRAGNANGLNAYTGFIARTTVNAGATLDLNGFSATVKNLQGAGSVTTGGTSATVLTVNAGSFSGDISGPGALTKETAGTLTLTGANTYAGPTTISGGTLQVGNGGTAGTLGAGDVTNNAALVFNRSDATSYNGVISGTGTLTKQGAGTLTLGGSAANTYTGLTSVTGGTLVLNKPAGVLALGGALAVGNAGADPAAGTAATAVVQLGQPNQTGSATNVTVHGDGLFNLANSTAVGALTLNGGEARINNNTFNLNGDVTVNASTAGARITSTDFIADLSLTTGTRTFTVADGAARYDLDLTAGVFNGTLVKAGPGTLRLDANNSAAVTLNAGTLAVGRNTALSGSSALTLAGGVLVADGGSAADAGARVVTRPVSVTGNAAVGSSLDGTSGGLTFTGATGLAAGATLTVSSNAATTFSNVVSGAGGIAKTGLGTLTLSNAANTFTGGLTLNGGTLAVAGDGSLGGAANVVTLNAGTLQFTRSATTARTFNLPNAVTLGNAAGTTLTFGNGASVNGGFLGAGGTLAFADGSALNGTTALIGSTLTQSGGTATFNNATLRGTFTQANGATLNATSGLNVAGSGVVTANGTVNLVNGGESLGRLAVNPGATVNVQGNALYLDAGSRTTVGSVGAPGGTLAAASGASVELAGLLTNNGVQSGVLNVNFGGVAKGGGSFGTVNVTDGGKFGVNAPASGVGSGGSTNARALAPGLLASTAGTGTVFTGPQPAATPATANVASLTLASGSLLALNVQNATGAAGAGYDTVFASGPLTLAAGTIPGSQITISLASLGANGSAGPAANFDASQSYAFTLVSAAGGIAGYDPAEFVVDASGFLNAINGGSFSVFQDGNNLVLAYQTVPEPSTWALLALGGAGLLGLTWRRQRTVRA